MNYSFMVQAMKPLVQEKQKAIKLRKKEYSYNDILKEIPVAKSSLSLWLKNLPLTEVEKRVLKKRNNANIARGRIVTAAANRQHRLQREQEYFREAKREFSVYVKNSLFHTGVALYWAEGAKRNSMFHFMNSDQVMVTVILMWLETFTEYSREQLGYRLYLHAPYKHQNWESWWQKRLHVSEKTFKKTIIKPTQLAIKKRPNYKGCLRVEVPRSGKLLIKMKFWTNMLVEHYKK